MSRAKSSVGIAVLVVGGLFAALPGAAVATLPACDIPSKTCFGDRINALVVDGGVEPGCTACVQAECCDVVGSCQEDPACVDNFKAAHTCVIANGPGEESRCTTDLTPKARALYACMRESCGGPTCRVPNCDVDRAAGLIVSPECDRCVGGGCCEPLNACYGDRRCKLIVECITDKCKDTVGASMLLLGSLAEATRTRLVDQVCSGGEPAGGPTDCLEDCINDFAPVGEKGTADDKSARCRAFQVFTCAATQRCGEKCVVRLDASAPADAGASEAGSDASDASSD